jgi:protocatechuate 3,4-dioxygenase beta subunit
VCAGKIASKAVTLNAGNEPNLRTPYFPAIGYTENGAVDFGLAPIIDATKFSIGNRVWIDTGAGANANNGVIDTDERGAAGITVTLRLSNTLAQIAQTLTDLNGYYRFDNLDAGDYIVEVTQPAGYTPSAVSEADPDTNGDSNHNCVTPVAGAVRSAAVTLGPLADEPQNELDLASNGQGSDDNRANMTVDCGFVVPLHSLGNHVFNDANNNGMFDPATETNIGNVSINLYFDINADGRVGSDEMSAPILTTTTNSSGLYLFDRLAPGNYMVELASSNFVTGGVLVGYASSSGAGGSASGPFEPSGDPDNPAAQADAKDFGSRALDGSGRTTIRSATVTINTNTEPLVNTALDGNGIPNDGVLDPIEIPTYDNDSATLDGNENLTVDFGVYKPYAVGNRVWFDSNDNGAMDGDEFGLPGVSMTLNTAAGALVATTTTDLDGYYSFDSLFAGDYVVCADIPSGMKSSTDIASSTLPNNDIDKDENGVDLSNPNKVCSASVTLGDAAGADTEPQNEPDSSLTDSSDARANLTVDFGFFEPVSLGSRVFFDEPNQGYRVSGQRNGVPSFTVSLYEDNNDDGLADGSAIAISETNFAGDYFFTGLRPGTYIVSIVPPAGQPFVSSSGKQGLLTGPYEGPSAIDPDFGPGGGINNDDNGITRSDGSVWGKGITLRSRDENAADSDTNPNVNRSYDFGFFKPLSLGNIVWDDLDDNGLKGASEPGIAGVQVNLYWDANSDGEVNLIERAAPILTTTTDVDGLYLFKNLGAGNFVVELDPSAFAAGGRLHGYISSDDVSAGTVGPYEPGPDPDDATGPNGNPIDQDDNGSNVNAGIQSKGVTLKADTEPTAEDPNNDSATLDKNSNLTVDFGVYRPFSIGNRVWMDENQNSKQDGSEQGAADVLVKLLLPDETIVGSTNTDAKGYYRFDALRAGEYIVEVDATNFFSIGFGTAETAGPLYQLVNSAINVNDPNDDADQDDNGIGSSSVITGVRSGILKLGYGATEPDGESDVSDGGQGTEDNFANMTVDFGFHVNEPLAVTLDLFKASFASNAVVVNWRTSLERNTLGFNVWRSASGKRNDAIKITPSIIDAKGATGGTYEFFDANGAAGASYWLEEIELTGTSIWYGAAVVGSPTNVSNSFDVASGGVSIQIVGATDAPVVVSEPSAPLQMVVRGSETTIRPSLRSSQESVSVASADTNQSSASQTLAQVMSQQRLESQSRETVQVARDETTVASTIESNTSDEPKTLTAQASEQELSIIIERGSSEPSRLVVSAAPEQIKSTSRSPIPHLVGVWIGLMIFVGALLLRKVYKMTR